ASQKTGNLPGFRCLVSPMHLLGAALPTCSINPGLSWQWLWKDKVYKEAGTETISILPYLMGPPVICTSSPEVMKQFVAMKGQSEKPPEAGILVRIWGPNVFSEGGDVWRRHRRIVQPAFSPRTYALICTETSRLYDEMVVAEAWMGKDTIDIPDVNVITHKLALLVISCCGFGNPLSWMHDSPAVSGSMSLHEAFSIVSAGSIERILLPRWMCNLPIRRVRQLEQAYSTVERFMRELIASRRRELVEGPKQDSKGSEDGPDTSEYRDVFRIMLEASEQERKHALNDEELVFTRNNSRRKYLLLTVEQQGNTFVMLFAGHETTSNTLNAAIGFLACHSEIQDEVYEEVKSMLDGNELDLNTLEKLDKVQACFLEAGRLLPTAFAMPRTTVVNNVVVTHAGPPGLPDEKLVLEKGTVLYVDAIGVLYNPRVFNDPYAFKPERWYGATANDMLMFSVGARACLGRRFALSEGVAFLAKLIKDWKIEPILLSGETENQWRSRVLTAKMRLTLAVADVPVRLRRRV
ncbi:uncharacterized protein PHACADRAFT_100698, partial [Phanerochaete carnosa HHB-10118-sp]